MVVDRALPPPSGVAARAAASSASRPGAADAAGAGEGASGGAGAGAAAAARPLVDTVELSSAGGAPSPWLERVSRVAGAGRGSDSGALGLDVVV